MAGLHHDKKKQKYSFLNLDIFSQPLPAYKMASVPASAAPVLGNFLGPCMEQWDTERLQFVSDKNHWGHRTVGWIFMNLYEPFSHEHQSEQVSARSARAKRAVQGKQMSKWCKQMSEGRSEWPSTFYPLCIERKRARKKGTHDLHSTKVHPSLFNV